MPSQAVRSGSESLHHKRSYLLVTVESQLVFLCPPCALQMTRIQSDKGSLNPPLIPGDSPGQRSMGFPMLGSKEQSRRRK